jgi:hypothetical protein
MNELHLDLTTELLTLVTHDKLRNRLVTHVSRPIDLSAKLFDLPHPVLFSQLKPRFNQSQVTTNVFKHSNTRLIWRPVSLWLQCEALVVFVALKRRD